MMCPDTQEEKQLLFLAGPTDLIRTPGGSPGVTASPDATVSPRLLGPPFRPASSCVQSPSWPAGGAGAQEMAPAWPASGKLFNRPVCC